MHLAAILAVFFFHSNKFDLFSMVYKSIPYSSNNNFLINQFSLIL